MTKPANVKALETGSGTSWEDWLEFLEPHRDLDHTAMAVLVREHIVGVGLSSSPEWWAQGVTLAFEQHIGRRKPGQRSGGTFSVTVSATANCGMDAALEAWTAAMDGAKELDGVALKGPARSSATEKWRYWRCTLDDGSAVSVNFQAKAGGLKTTVSANHDKIPDQSAVETWRTFWRQQLAVLKG